MFDILSVVFAGALGYSILLYFSGNANFVLLLSSAGLFLVFSFFDFLFTKESRRRVIIGFLQILAFLIFFYSVKIAVLISALGVLAFFYFMAWHSTQFMLDNSIKIKLGSVSKAYMKNLFIGFALAGVILYIPQWNSGNVFVPQPQFQKWYDGFASFSERFSLPVDLGASVGALAEHVARTQLSTNNQFQLLPESEQEQLVRKSALEIVANTSKNISLNIVPEMPLGEAIYNYIVNFLTKLKDQFGGSFVAALAVGFFVVTVSLGAIFVAILAGLAYLIFEIFAAFNIAHVVGENTTKEIIQLS